MKSCVLVVSIASHCGQNRVAGENPAVIVLDTDILTLIQRKRGSQYQEIAARLDALNDEVCVTIVSFEEQLRGWLALISKARLSMAQVPAYLRLSELFQDFQTRRVLEFDVAASGVFDRLRRDYRRTGAMDLKIAAIAMIHDALLLSRNLSDFSRVPGLRVENWLD